MNRQRIRYSMIFILFLLFPAIFYYMSPYIIIDGTIHGVITGSFILFSLQFITALILGRLFCGWICPAGGVQEAVFRINEKRIKKGNIIKGADVDNLVIFGTISSISSAGSLVFRS